MMQIGMLDSSIESTLSPRNFVSTNAIPILLKNKVNSIQKKV
jgi:hypothetical protein